MKAHILTILMAFMVGVTVGAIAAGYNLEPVKIEAGHEEGLYTITYRNGSNYHYEEMAR